MLLRDEIEALARGRIPLGETEVIPQDAELKIGQPAVRPPDDVIVAVAQHSPPTSVP